MVFFPGVSVAVGFAVCLVATLGWTVSASTTFGHELRKDFLMDPTLVNLNAASFGTLCKKSHEAEAKFNLMMESNVNTWIRGGYAPYLNAVRTRLSNYVNADVDGLVLVENASSGVNAVLRSLADELNLKKGDKVLHMNIAYDMVRHVFAYLARVRGFEIVNVTVPFPIKSKEDFLGPIKQALDLHGSSIRIASFDHISSFPAAILPIKELVAMCQSRGILTLVDGAHALGQIPVDIADINPDFYIANAHKWLYSPKGTGFLWVKKDYRTLIHPAVLNNLDSAPYVAKYEYVGTRNYCAYLAIDDAMSYRATLGDKAIMDYLHTLAWSAGQKIAALWKTSLLVSDENLVPALNGIVTPSQEGAKVNWVRAELLKRYNTYIQTGSYQNDPKEPEVFYLRITAQIYLEMSDFTLMAQRFLDLLKEAP